MLASRHGGRRPHSGRDCIDGARLFLIEQAPTSTLKQLLIATLDVAEALTGSTIGFFHFVAEDQQGLLARQFQGGLVGVFDETLRLAWVCGEHPPAGQAAAVEQAFREALDGRSGEARLEVGGVAGTVRTSPVPVEGGEGQLGLAVFRQPG